MNSALNCHLFLVTLGALWACVATSKEEYKITKTLIQLSIHSSGDEKNEVVDFLCINFHQCYVTLIFFLDSRFHSSADNKQSEILVRFL